MINLLKLLILFLFLPLTAYSEMIPRRVIAFWDSLAEEIVEDSLVHMTLELPLNHLGIEVIYHDIHEPLPDIIQRKDIRGVVLCFQKGTSMHNPILFIDWLVEVMDAGKKLIILKNSGFITNSQGINTPNEHLNRIYEKIGFTNTQEWVNYPFEYQILERNSELFPFEKNFPTPLPGFEICKIYASYAKSYLTVGIQGKPASESDLIIISSYGAFVSEDYTNTFDKILYTTDPISLGWYFNPFRFFELALDLSFLPIPDTTTLLGRRIFTSTCHGDFWNGSTDIEEFKKKRTSCAEVILEKVIKPNPDIPIAVGVVAADVDPKWVAKKDSQEITRRYFALPQVEAASHTYSHPYDWNFFKTGSYQKEIDFLHLYPYGSWQNSFLSWYRAKKFQLFSPKEFEKKKLKWGFATPRTYANEPFDINKEISGAANFLSQFAPPDNKVKLLIWSGDSIPWEAAVKLTYQAGLKNYGGGFVQYDANRPSYLFVFPLGRNLGGYIQLYTGANGDNNYTDEWKEKFYAFQFLTGTLKNTETPRRVKPINLYFHIYSGEFQASVNAILSNIAFIRTQLPISMTVNRYCDIGAGFYSIEFEKMGQRRWKIHKRQGLQTIRFENGEKLKLDFNNSEGVIGCKTYQGVLYVHLDPIYENPIVALAEREEINDAHHPFIIDSTWEIWNVETNSHSIGFRSSGWGKMLMNLKMGSGGAYKIEVNNLPSKTFTTSPDNILNIELDLPNNIEVKIKIGKI